MNSDEIYFFNKRHVDKMRKKLVNYDTDEKKDKRILDWECKYCTYINIDRIAGQAFTSSHCKECTKMIVTPTTDVDAYCIDCAKKLKVCKHCGSKMD